MEMRNIFYRFKIRSLPTLTHIFPRTIKTRPLTTSPLIPSSWEMRTTMRSLSSARTKDCLSSKTSTAPCRVGTSFLRLEQNSYPHGDRSDLRSLGQLLLRPYRPKCSGVWRCFVRVR